MSQALYLSHWDAEIPIVVPSNVVNDLANYHIMGIRYLYGCYSKGQKGAVFNVDEDMNTQIQISAFLSALDTSITTNSPVIVVCDKQSLLTWHYYLGKYVNNDISLICANNTNTDSFKIILCTVENLKWLKSANMTFFVVVIDDLDLNLNRKFVKQLKGQFRIGLTKRNFVKNPDQKLFRNMLHWAVPGVVGKLEEFIKEDYDHLINLRFPYSEWWLRITWSLCDTFKKPTLEEKMKIKASIRTWSKDQNLTVDEEEKIRPKRRRKKETDKVIAKSCKIESDSSQDTVICDQEIDQTTIDDLPIFTSTVNNDIKPSNLFSFDDRETKMSEDDVLSMLLGEPKMESQKPDDVLLSTIIDEDDVESRNRDVLSLIYGD